MASKTSTHHSSSEDDTDADEHAAASPVPSLTDAEIAAEYVTAKRLEALRKLLRNPLADATPTPRGRIEQRRQQRQHTMTRNTEDGPAR